MPAPAVGMAVGSIAGAAISADAAGDAADQASDDRQAVLAFEQQRYNDWKAMYGGIEENLASYYENLTPDKFITQNMEAYETELEGVRERIRTSFAQRGIRPDSGVALGAEAGLELARGEKRASIRANAEQEVMDRKQSFLGLGVQRDPSNSYSSALQQQSAYSTQASNQASAAAGQAMGQAISDTTTALSDYFREE